MMCFVARCQKCHLKFVILGLRQILLLEVDLILDWQKAGLTRGAGDTIFLYLIERQMLIIISRLTFAFPHIL